MSLESQCINSMGNGSTARVKTLSQSRPKEIAMCDVASGSVGKGDEKASANSEKKNIVGVNDGGN